MDAHVAQSVTVFESKDDILNGNELDAVATIYIYRENGKDNLPTSGLINFKHSDDSEDEYVFTIVEASYDQKMGHGLAGHEDHLIVTIDNGEIQGKKEILFQKLNGEVMGIVFRPGNGTILLGNIESEWNTQISDATNFLVASNASLFFKDFDALAQWKYEEYDQTIYYTFFPESNSGIFVQHKSGDAYENKTEQLFSIISVEEKSIIEDGIEKKEVSYIVKFEGTDSHEEYITITYNEEVVEGVLCSYDGKYIYSVNIEMKEF